ncbi:MAG: hypothetical protein J4N96_00695 [Chloroflexi bacterium]|nr:hypothetical protein [Chloroflexota bacterium]MCI0836123.1 hypothetical protein [Chloroflexota bacterium]
MSDDFDELLSLANREREEQKELIAEIIAMMHPENPSKAEARTAKMLRAWVRAWMQANPPSIEQSGLGN